MRSVSTLALGSVACGCLTFVLSYLVLRTRIGVDGIGLVLIMAAGYAFGNSSDLALQVERLATPGEAWIASVMTGRLITRLVPAAVLAGFAGAALGWAALKRSDARGGQRRGRTLARIGIALVVLSLLNSCIVIVLILSQPRTDGLT